MLQFIFILLLIFNSNFKVESIIYENFYDVNVNLALNKIDINLLNKTFTNINCTIQAFDSTRTINNPTIVYPTRTSCSYTFDKR